MKLCERSLKLSYFEEYIPKPVNAQVLYQAKYEAKNKNTHVLLHDDIQCARDGQKEVCLTTGKLKGFVQQINQDPFGYVLISDIQVFNLSNF